MIIGFPGYPTLTPAICDATLRLELSGSNVTTFGIEGCRYGLFFIKILCIFVPCSF